MISKQETFKRILSGYYTEYSMVETELWELMKKRHNWGLTFSPSQDKHIAFRMVNSKWFIKQVHENGPEWHKDIKECAKELGML